MDGLNEYRTARVADILADFRNLQYFIAAAPTDPSNIDDYYTEGWAALRQCAIDGQHILNCAADVTVPQANGGEAEQQRAELKQCVEYLAKSITNAVDFPSKTRKPLTLNPFCRILLDAYSRRHEGQKIYLRQAAAQRWIEYRETILQGQRPKSSHRRQLRACDEQLRGELSRITDEYVYQELQTSDMAMGRWTAEDPSLRSVQRWVRARPQTT
ncbi:uncharacterized protein F4807DRAFT_458567 [Annulohypoxylon truncatum]|uniref:uncharacterized protein n=1 Tax=Annulohypoxylon truncatum TaxID=327061 RepID=UPI0020081EE4|nr:uncharacterized protein F4807DRAFT_458567 [Annulohypoxylon truncatum]KAI1211672.1 hypothetical protein F4807DRAFT_458567 [Annulohypoxylon truncatum]